jgi:hypothetical protein
VSERRRKGDLESIALDGESADIVDLLAEVAEWQETDIWEDMVHLIESLSAVLRPVTASPHFIRDLGQGLSAAGAPAEITIGRPRRRWSLWLGAVLSGSLVSAMGVLVVWLRRRNRRSPLMASQPAGN